LSSPDLAEWQALQNRVQERLDSDIIVHIEDKFRQITSRRQREECLIRLQKSLQESMPDTMPEEATHG
jgi:adenylate kinase